MAKLSVIQDAIMLCRAAEITPFVWGHRGLGKSASVKQLTARNGMGFIDMRCSQMEASDLRGLPDRGSDGRTHFMPPADMPVGDLSLEQIKQSLGKVPPVTDLPAFSAFEQKLANVQGRYETGILFLDELNRGQDDVLQATFQLVLDRRCGQYVLPHGWSIVAAGNYMEGYQVSGFNDPAFINRFCHLNLSSGETTLNEWVDYMAGRFGSDASSVIEFASQNMKHLDGDVAGERGFTVQPSRRSWDAVVRVEQACKRTHYSEEAKFAVIAGLVGDDAAATYTRYNCPVKPMQILNDGVKPHKSVLEKLSRGQLIGLMWGLISCSKNRITEKEVSDVCLDFAEFMLKVSNDKDIVVAFCRGLICVKGDENEKTEAAVLSNPALAKLVAQYQNKSGTKKGFIARLSERPALQQALSKVTWGE